MTTDHLEGFWKMMSKWLLLSELVTILDELPHAQEPYDRLGMEPCGLEDDGASDGC